MKLEIKKILILSIPGLGNTIMITPMLKLLAISFPEAQITVLVTLGSCKKLLENCPYVHEVIIVDGRLFRRIWQKFKVLFALRLQKFDVCITAFPANDIRYNLLTWCIGAKIRIGHSYPIKNIRTLPWLQNVKLPMAMDKHDVLQNLDLLKPLGISLAVRAAVPAVLRHTGEAEASPCDLIASEASRGACEAFRVRSPSACETHKVELTIWPTVEDVNNSLEFLKRHRILSHDIVIGMHPGSSEKREMIYKRWPKEKFAALGDRIMHEYENVKILLFGGEDELKAKIAAMMQRKPVIVSKMSIREVAVLIERCHLFICNDSGLMHVASAMKVPIVAIFGPTDPIATAPYGVRHIIVAQDFTCRPCWPIKIYGRRPDCQRNPSYTCVRDLPVEAVFKAVKTLFCEQFDL